MPNSIIAEPSTYIGDLRKRITIQKPNQLSNGDLDPTMPWVNAYDNDIWASVTPVAGFELFAAQQIYPGSHTTIIIRYRDTPAGTTWEKCRVYYQGRTFDIIDHHDVEERHRVIELSCVERPADRAT